MRFIYLEDEWCILFAYLEICISIEASDENSGTKKTKP